MWLNVLELEYITIFSVWWRKLESLPGAAAVEWMTSLVDLTIKPVDRNTILLLILSSLESLASWL